MFRDIGEAFDLRAVDLVHDGVAEVVGVGVHRVGQDPAQDNDLRAFLVDFVLDEKIKHVAEAEVVRLVGGHEILVNGLEDQPAENNEAGLFVVNIAVEVERPGVAERDFELLGFSLPQDVERDMVALEFTLDRLRQRNRPVLQRNRRVAQDRQPVDGQEDISGFDDPISGTAAINASHQHAEVIVFQAERLAGRRVEECLVAERQIHVAVVMAVLDILEEPFDDGRRDHVADVLGDISAISLEGHADDFAILHDRAAAVAGVDRRIDLDRQVGIHPRVRVRLEVDARDDPLGHREAGPADRVAVDRNDRFDRGDTTQIQCCGVFEKAGVIHGQHREVAIVRDKKHARLAGFGIALLGNRQEPRVADDVGICHDAVAADDEPGPDSAGDLARIPRRLVVGFLGGGFDADEALGNRRGLGDSRDNCRNHQKTKHRRQRRHEHRFDNSHFQAASTGLPAGESARSLATTAGTSSQARAKSPAEL